jgi:predicted transcriptional regulator
MSTRIGGMVTINGKVVVSARVEQGLREQLERIAKEDRRDLSEVIVFALEKYVKLPKSARP